MEQAPAQIAFRVSGLVLPVVGITGPVGAGKSTLARRLSPCVLSTDDYLPDYDRVEYAQRDNPSLIDWPMLLSNLAALRLGSPTEVPVWSFQSHSRTGTRLLSPAPGAPIVIEGLHALHTKLAQVLALGVFIHAPADVRWSRWEHLERTGQRGWGVSVARAFFDSVAEPTFAKHEPEYRARAHMIVTNA
jgi:uridine kinase